METAVAANDDEDIKAMLLNVMEAPQTKLKPSTPDSYCNSSESERVNASSSVLTALESNEDCVGPGAETCSLCLYVWFGWFPKISHMTFQMNDSN